MKYTINELANSKGVSQPVRETLLQMADYKQLYEQVCEQYDVLAKELEATNRQVEILSDALAESRREVAAKDEALKMALEALDSLQRMASTFADELHDKHPDVIQARVAVRAIKQALAAPLQEPVSEKEISAWAERHDIQGTPTDLRSMFEDAASLATPPAAAPVQEPWVGLTEQERNDIEDYCEMIVGKPAFEAIEAKLKERNT